LICPHSVAGGSPENGSPWVALVYTRTTTSAGPWHAGQDQISAEEEMQETPDRRKFVLEVAQEHIGTVDDVRAALNRLVADIADDRLKNARGIQVLILA
jgi:hypothetical protein